MARGFVQGDVERGAFTVSTDGRTSITLVQRSFPSATVSVFNAGTAVLSTIFSDAGGTPLANPFTADTDGHWAFWANPGSYDIQFSGTSVGIASPYTRFAFFVPDTAVTAPIPDPGSNGILARTNLQVVTPRTITGTTNEITVSNGDGVAGNPTISIPASVTFTAKTITGGAYLPTTIVGGTHTSITSFSLRSSGAAFDTAIAVQEVLTANRQLELRVQDSNRQLFMGGNINISNNFTTIGNFSLTFTQTGTTSVTTPTTGTLATLAGVETFTNKTLTSPKIGTAILDTNGNEMLGIAVAGSAVNEITIQNASTGNAPAFSATGNDPNIGLVIAGKGTGSVTLSTNSSAAQLILTSTPELYLGNGIVNVSPTNFTILGTGGSGTNQTGANLELSGGKGTGNGTPGMVAIRYPLIGASGSGGQALSTDRFPISIASYTNTTVGTSINNTVAETSLFTGVTGSSGSTRTIEGGSARAGSAYKILAYGAFNTTGTPTVRFKVKLGSNIVADSSAYNANTNAAGVFFIEATIFVESVGAAGSVVTPFEARTTGNTAGASTPVFAYGASGVVSVDFTANQTIDLTIQWGTASASNAAQIFAISIERLR